MERKQFKFLRSYYDSISKMPPAVQAELYPAIVEYALFNKKPEGLSDQASGVFLLLQPLVKAHITRCANGRKGGRRKGSKNKPKEEPQVVLVASDTYPRPLSPLPASDYTKTYEEEVAEMKQSDQWLYNVCSRLSLTKEQVFTWLDKFAGHCSMEESKHQSLTDAKRHFNNWMRKVYQPKEEPQPTPASSDFGYDGGFGSKDV